MMMDMNKFTQRAQEAIAESQNIALRYRHQQLEGEHLHAALCAQQDGLIPRLLTLMEVDVPAYTAELERELEKLPSVSGGSQLYASRRFGELLAQAQEEGVIRYQSEADGSLCVLSAFADGSCLRMSRPGVTAFTVFKERLLIYALIVVGVCALVFAMVYLYDMRRRSVIRQVTDVLTDFSDGR